jgi:hypothetical protein
MQKPAERGQWCHGSRITANRLDSSAQGKPTSIFFEAFALQTNDRRGGDHAIDMPNDQERNVTLSHPTRKMRHVKPEGGPVLDVPNVPRIFATLSKWCEKRF